MARMDRWRREETAEAPLRRLERHQLRAIASPRTSLRQLAGNGDEPPSGSALGNFKDLEDLLEQLGSPPVLELGNPLPDARFLPRRRIGRCPAEHNRALLDRTD